MERAETAGKLCRGKGTEKGEIGLLAWVGGKRMGGCMSACVGRDGGAGRWLSVWRVGRAVRGIGEGCLGG